MNPWLPLPFPFLPHSRYAVSIHPEIFRDAPPDGEGHVGQWRRAARHMSQLTADPEELKRAEEALAEDMSEENLRRLQAILDRMRRESVESGAG